MNKQDQMLFEKWLNENDERTALAIRHGIPPEQVPELMCLHALEGVNVTLADVCRRLEDLQDALETVGECIEHPEHGSPFLNVGNIPLCN